MSATSPPACVIVAAPFSGAAFLAAMLGRHPDLRAVPELNLAMAPSMRELLYLFDLAQGPIADGLLRAVARLAFGASDDAGILRARHWLTERSDATTADVLCELVRLAAPARLVVHDTECALRPNDLLRVAESCAPSPIVHLVRHPWSQGVVAANRLGDRLFVAGDFKDHARTPPCLDPQLAWLRANSNVERWLEAREPGRVVRIVWEDLIADPEATLRDLCARLGVRFDAAVHASMLDYDRWEFWGYGPRAAPFGLDREALEPLSEDLLDRAFVQPRLDRPLPWRSDGAGFDPAVQILARRLGIDAR